MVKDVYALKCSVVPTAIRAGNVGFLTLFVVPIAVELILKSLIGPIVELNPHRYPLLDPTLRPSHTLTPLGAVVNFVEHVEVCGSSVGIARHTLPVSVAEGYWVVNVVATRVPGEEISRSRSAPSQKLYVSVPCLYLFRESVP